MKVKKSCFVTRGGRIARLPLPIREQINHRLEDGRGGRTKAHAVGSWCCHIPLRQAGPVADKTAERERSKGATPLCGSLPAPQGERAEFVLFVLFGG